ncbi:HAD hydrolase-like protein [uncultured Ilyobacter sp.]|uniref:HAD hydrolase-like protein n=1 Tax=uncultured Ilyobacter sp. TaxID=544433 RepID=UPI0029F5CBD4|nr:HAD hydrolase-like protein [uncultured Ilyobacter sp.]
MKKFDLVIFDLDGTLTDSRVGITKSVSHALDKMGIKPPSLKELEHFIGPPLMDTFMGHYKFSKSDSEKAVELFRERYSEKGLYENIPFHNINTLLSNLKKSGIKLAVATSKPQHFSEKILEISAILHDIGIKISEEKYNSSAGKYQELEGPGAAKKLIKDIDLPEKIKERVYYLIGNHHSYDKIDGLDFQILVEADFLVNIYEDNMSSETAATVKKKYFETKTGREYISSLYGV